MSLKILVDMNLSPGWVPPLLAEGWKTVHWSSIGNADAPDEDLLAWSLDHSFAIFTLDHDFPRILAVFEYELPSVILLRTEESLPVMILHRVVDAIRTFEAELLAGALVVVDEKRSRCRPLPLR